MTTFTKTALTCALALSLFGADAFAQSSRTRQARSSQAQARQTRVAPRVTPRRATGTANGAGLGRVGGLDARVQQQVATLSRSMERSIRGQATPPMEVVSANPAVRLQQTEYPHYKLNRTAKFKVSGLKDGKLDLVTLLPVSGHVGLQNAQSYAKTNKYNIVVTHADGTRQTLDKVSSTGFVTQKQLNLKLKPGKTVIQAWADGSAGVGGYKAGREIEIHWDGK